MVIGFRSFPDGFAYVILNGTQSSTEVVAKDRLSLPQNNSWPACLSWVRKQLSEILRNHNITSACIKTVEPMAKKKSVERFHIDAVILENIHSIKGIDCNTRIKSQLKRDIKDFTDPARYIERVLVEDSSLSELNNAQYQEAALAAVSELPED